MWRKLHQKISLSVAMLQPYVGRPWYPPLLALLSTLDYLVIVIPTDGLLISSSMLVPKRWMLIAVSIAGGSTLGALALAEIVEHQGLPWILDLYPHIAETQTWILSLKFFDQYGLFLVFAVALSPFMQHPAIILAAIAHTPLLQLAAVVFAGRVIKALLLAYLASHAPRVLGRFWGLKSELKDVGVKLN